MENSDDNNISDILNPLSFTGTQINYYFLCKRKLWYFSNNIEMERESDNVQIGRMLHEHSYQREKKEIEIDGKIKIDFIGKDAVISEVKKSDKMEESHIRQLKYYLYYLKLKKKVSNLTGRIHYPKLKKTLDVFLTDEDIVEFAKTLADIAEILKTDKPPVANKMRICSKCSYYELCFISE